MTAQDYLHMTRRDFIISIGCTNVVGICSDFFDKSFNRPANQLGSPFLNFSDLLVGLHDRLDALKGKFFAEPLFHFNL